MSSACGSSPPDHVPLWMVGFLVRQGVLLVIGVGHSNMRFYSYVIPILGLPGLGSADSLVCCRIIKCLVAHDYKRGEFCKILPVVNLAAKVAKYPSVMLPSGKNNITNFSRIQYASLVSSFSEAHRTGYFAYSYITIVIVIIITLGVCRLTSVSSTVSRKYHTRRRRKDIETCCHQA